MRVATGSRRRCVQSDRLGVVHQDDPSARSPGLQFAPTGAAKTTLEPLLVVKSADHEPFGAVRRRRSVTSDSRASPDRKRSEKSGPRNASVRLPQRILPASKTSRMCSSPSA